MLQRLSVRTIVIGGAVLIASAFTAIVGFGSALAVHDFMIRSAVERHEDLARQLALDYEDFLALHRHAVEAVAHQAAARERLDMSTLRDVLVATNEVYPAIWGLGVTDAAGRLVASDPARTSDGRSAVGIDLSDRPWFKELTRTLKPVISRDIVVARLQTTPTISINVPVLDAAGQLRGVASAGLDLARVRRVAERIHIGATGRANVASADGVLFATGAEALLGLDVAERPEWRAMRQAASGRVMRYQAPDGGERLAGFATVPGVEWKVWVSQEIREIEHEVRGTYLRMAGWLLAALVGVTAGAVFVGLAVTRPLGAVQRTAASIADGQLDRRAPEQGPSEIVDLARSFNRMGDAVRGLLETERNNRRHLEHALEQYGTLAARVARGDLHARVVPGGDPKVAELGVDLNSMAAELERRVNEAARFARITERATDAYLMIDRAGRLSYVNEVAAERLGYTKAELLRQELSTIDAGLSEAELADLFHRATSGEAVPPFESLHRRSDGATYPVEVSLTPVDLDGEPQVFAAVRDITRRKRMESQLRAESEALETVNRASRMLSAELDPERLVQGLTDAATQLTGAAFGAFFYNVNDPAGGRYMLYALSGAPKEAFAGFEMPRATPLFGPTFRGDGILRVDDVTTDPRYGRVPPHHGLPHGHLPVRSYLAVPVVSRTGDVLGGLFFGHPTAGMFTERHERMAIALAAQAAVAMDNARLYEHEQRSRASAEAANRSKDEFLATLSHELRTPLNAILGWTVMLRADQVPPQGRERALAAIERNARAQRQLIEDLLDISRIITGKLRLDAAPLDLATAVEAAVDAMRPAAQTKQLTMDVALEPTPVTGDAERLQQVASNLVSNAVKFTPAGGRIDVRLRRVGPDAELVVRDTGAGIAADVLPHIFDRFRQADSSITREYGGLGLGLSLVKHLVELHAGTVAAESAGLGAGATFTVRIPMGRDDEALAVRGPRLDTATMDVAALAGRRILLVDDHQETLDLLAETLVRRGAVVETATDAQRALTAFHTSRPDVIISDIAMPGADGYMLLRKIRSLLPAEGGNVPAIALTAHAGRDERLRSLAAGFQVHLTKPADPAEIVLAVANLTAPRV
jgi:PAS domain S-box-containing protein